ncbi:alpha/beta fold hydrolase [Streptomyces xanthophaeus]|uniref:alpha/beta fold hydrolase n=1 Tax=Streptomyces xanthophaeus TaxID=67385 RepID=UPI0004CD96CE|nr:alpha/beta hydrolase [Streptomyces xanthophaeus]
MSEVVSSDGTAIACEQHGDAGPAAILVGGTLMTRFRHTPLASLLAGDFSVINYDRRGRGESGDGPVYEVQREVDDLEALIERVGGGGPVLLFGMSSGAVLALEAVAGGSAVSALALYEPPFIVDDARPPQPAEYVDRMKAIVARDEAIAQMRRTPVWAAWEAAAPTLPYDGQLMADFMSGRPLPTDRRRSVKVPVLAGYGSASETYLANGAKELAARRDNYTLHALPGQTHNVDPHALAPVLTTFFAAAG